jgi:hypothetical protein
MSSIEQPYVMDGEVSDSVDPTQPVPFSKILDRAEVKLDVNVETDEEFDRRWFDGVSLD